MAKPRLGVEARPRAGNVPILVRSEGLRARGCITKCRGPVRPGQQSQDHSPMALSGRAVSQHLWLAHGAARLRAHEGWFDPAVLPRRTAAGSRCGRRRRAADGSPVSGGSWVEWAHAGQPPGTNARSRIRSARAGRRRRPGNHFRRHPVSSFRSRSMIRGGRLVGDEPGRWQRTADPCARGRARANYLGLVHVNARDRSRVGGQLALRPGFSALARMPPTALRAPRGERRGLLVLTAGPVRTSTGVTPPARWPRPNVSERSRVLVLFRASPRGNGKA